MFTDNADDPAHEGSLDSLRDSPVSTIAGGGLRANHEVLRIVAGGYWAGGVAGSKKV